MAFAQLDLDGRLCYASAVVVLTSTRLLAFCGESAQPSASAAGADAKVPFAQTPSGQWSISDISRLTTSDRGGLGTLEAIGHECRLANWYFTIGRAAAVKELVSTFEQLKRGAWQGPIPEEADASFPEAVESTSPPSVGSLLRLFRFAKGHKAALLLGVVLTLSTTAAGLVPPYLTWPLVDEILDPYQNQVRNIRGDATLGSTQKAESLSELRVTGREPFRRVPWFLAGMAGAAVAAWLLGWAQGWVLAWLSERISADLRNTTYEHLQRLSLEYFSAKRTGDLVARISSDTDRICTFLSDSLMDFVTDVLMIVGTAGMLFYMDPLLAVATLCTFPIVAWLTLYIRERLQHGFLHGSRAWADMTSILADTIPGIRVVKAFAQEQREVERFRTSNDAIVAANDRVNRVWTFFWPMVALLNQVGLLVAWGFGAWQVFDQRITVGVLTAFLAYIGRFYTRLESMSRMATITQRAAASAQRIFEILDRAPSVPEPARPVHPGRLAGRIELHNVGFRFGNRQVIDGVTLEIRPGEMLGLVGTTGAGKSTLVNLVCRFYDVGEGAVLVDGTDIRSFPVAEYRRNIGIVLQDPFLFYGTIADNISYGRPRATRAEIVAAARAARAHEFILQLPDGYDSLVGERGQTLSGGERQRISIARALLIDPRILILDEATSSVDTQTERHIQEALDNLVRGRTTIAIAHRLSTLRKADRLIVLDHGRIVETGTHEQLLDAGGTYARLCQAQGQLSREGVLAPQRRAARAVAVAGDAPEAAP